MERWNETTKWIETNGNETRIRLEKRYMLLWPLAKLQESIDISFLTNSIHSYAMCGCCCVVVVVDLGSLEVVVVSCDSCMRERIYQDESSFDRHIIGWWCSLIIVRDVRFEHWTLANEAKERKSQRVLMVWITVQFDEPSQPSSNNRPLIHKVTIMISTVLLQYCNIYAAQMLNTHRASLHSIEYWTLNKILNIKHRRTLYRFICLGRLCKLRCQWNTSQQSLCDAINNNHSVRYRCYVLRIRYVITR